MATEGLANLFSTNIGTGGIIESTPGAVGVLPVKDPAPPALTGLQFAVIVNPGNSNQEIMEVTAGQGTTNWTVTRGSEPLGVAGTAIAPKHNPNEPVEAVVTVQGLKNFITANSPVTVLGKSNGSDDTSWINTILAAAGPGSYIRGTPGQTYLISAPLVLRAGGQTTLDMMGCTIKYATTAVRTNMLNNAAVAPSNTATDVATTLGSSVINSPQLVAAGAAVGHSVAVVGAGPSNPAGGNSARLWFYGSIQSVVGNNITLGGMLNYGSWNPNRADIGLTNATGYLYKTRDANVTVIGGTWDQGTNWNVSADRYNAAFNSNVMRFRRCDGLTVRDARFAIDYGYVSSGLGWCFGVNPGDCSQILIEGLRNAAGQAASTFVNSSGMIQKCIVRNIQGVSYDDMVAFGTVGAAGDDVEGDIGDLEIDGVTSGFGGPAGWAGKGSNRGVDLYTGKGGNGQYRVMWGFEIRSVKGPYNSWPVSLVSYPAVAGQVANLQGDLKDINGYKIGGGPAIFIGRSDGTNAGLNNGLDCVGTVTGPNTGGDLAYAQLTANATFGPTRGDLSTPLLITFTAPPSGVVWLEAFAYTMQQGSGAGNMLMYIADNASNVVHQCFLGTIAASGFTTSPWIKVRVPNLVSGTSYTYKVQGSTSGTGAGTLLAGTSYPAWLKAVAA
jgi:hypothetical protein